MEIEDKDYLRSLYIYMSIMDNINKRLNELIKINVKNSPEKNIDLIYLIVSEIMRIIPYTYKDNKFILKKDGILLLKNKLNFIEEDYNKILNDENLEEALMNIYKVRNKFTHEPHNLFFDMSIGGETSYSVVINYKDNHHEISTIDLQIIVKKLNIIYEKIKNDFIYFIKKYDKKYRKYPIYEKVKTYKFCNYNKNI